MSDDEDFTPIRDAESKLLVRAARYPLAFVDGEPIDTYITGNGFCSPELLKAIQMDWQPIETAPPDNHVLVANANDALLPPVVAHYSLNAWRLSVAKNRTDKVAELIGEPTHWMPLPHPPT